MKSSKSPRKSVNAASISRCLDTLVEAVGPFDFEGGFDDRSDRRQNLAELMSRGYEDAYHQFIEPVVGASGERVGSTAV